jgi:hypothetical protein
MRGYGGSERRIPVSGKLSVPSEKQFCFLEFLKGSAIQPPPGKFPAVNIPSDNQFYLKRHGEGQGVVGNHRQGIGYALNVAQNGRG